jgi:autophagy-related protein 2
MAFYFPLPSSVVKRLIRYAIHQSGFLETDALDLDQLDIGWGKRSSIELRHVKLRKAKLDSLLHRPEQLSVAQASVLSVKITVPADLHTSAVEVDVRGVRVTVELQNKSPTPTEIPSTQHGTDKPSLKKRKSPFRAQSPGYTHYHDTDDDDNALLPSVHNLAKSFLAEEPLAEKKELEAAFASRSPDLRQSTASFASTDSEAEEGYGTGIGLPGFLAAFLRGMMDRLQVTIEDVRVKVDFSNSDLAKDYPRPPSALGVEIASIVSSHKGSPVPLVASPHKSSRADKRNFTLAQIQCSLLYDDVDVAQPDQSTNLNASSDLDPSETPTASTLFDNTATPYSIREAVRACRDDKSPRRSLNRSHMRHSFNSSGSSTPKMARSLSRRDSLERVPSSSPPSHDSDEHQNEDDLTQSTIFSQDDTESMYMSAIDDAAPVASFQGNMPGGWAEESISEREVHRSSSDKRQSTKAFPVSALVDIPDTPLATSVKSILECDRIDLWLPSSSENEVGELMPPIAPSPPSQSRQATNPQSSNTRPPGSFSSYAETRLRTGSTPARSGPPGTHADNSTQGSKRDDSEMLDIEIAPVAVSLDTTTLGIIVRLLYHITETKQPHSSSETGSPPSQSFPIARAVIRVLDVTLLEQLREQPWKPYRTEPINVSESRHMLSLSLRGLELFANADHLELNVNAVMLKAAGKPLVTFDDQARLRTSIRDLKEQSEKDFRMTMKSSIAGNEIDIKTKTVKINLDIGDLETSLESSEIFKILLGNGKSRTVDTMEAEASRRPRIVRFKSKELKPKEHENSANTKLNVRLSGSSILLRGSDHSMRCHTSAVKLVVRDQLFALKIDEVRTKGPYVNGLEDSMVAMRTRNLDIRYLSTPEEADLSRPSQNKFGDDDDLLVDTLIKQRRKGAVLRIQLSSAELDVLNKAGVIDGIGTFAHDLACVSTIAEYLPENNRPGPMTLIKVNELIMNVETDQAIGILNLTLGNSDFAHVSLPSFFACSVGKMQLDRDDQTPIITHLLQGDTVQVPPMLTARMIGDDPEQALKVKLWNTSFEYSIPLVLAALGLSEAGSVETLVANMAASVLSLTTGHSMDRPGDAVPARSEDSPLYAQVALRDCAIGFKPKSMPSRMLLMLSDASVRGSSMADATLSGQLYLKKGGILIVDDIHNLLPSGAEISSTSHDGKDDHVSKLCKQGFVSISSISAAVLELKLRRGSDSSADMFDIGFKDELFVFETCADSTQTLLDTLNDLLPPLPPPQGLRYRTEVAPMEDMLASFSGADFAVNLQAGAETPIHGKSGNEAIGSGLDLDFEDLGDMLDTPRARTVIPSVSNGRSDKQGRFGSVPHRLEELSRPTKILLSKLESHSLANKWDSVNNQYVPVSSAELETVPLRVRVRDVHFIWNLFDGYDWQRTRDTITKAVYDVEQRAEERKRRPVLEDAREQEPVIGDFLFNSIYIGVPASSDPQELTRQINRNMDDRVSETASMASTANSRPSSSHRAHKPHRKLKLERSRRHKLAIELRGLSADIVMYAPGGETQSSVDIRLTDLEIFDHVPTSTWKKFATYMHDAGPRPEGSPMIQLEICNVRPVPELLASELVIKVSTALRLYTSYANYILGHRLALALAHRPRRSRIHDTLFRIQR